MEFARRSHRSTKQAIRPAASTSRATVAPTAGSTTDSPSKRSSYSKTMPLSIETKILLKWAASQVHPTTREFLARATNPTKCRQIHTTTTSATKKWRWEAQAHLRLKNAMSSNNQVIVTMLANLQVPKASTHQCQPMGTLSKCNPKLYLTRQQILTRMEVKISKSLPTNVRSFTCCQLSQAYLRLILEATESRHWESI